MNGRTQMVRFETREAFLRMRQAALAAGMNQNKFCIMAIEAYSNQYLEEGDDMVKDLSTQETPSSDFPG